MAADGRPFPDTYYGYYLIQELSEAGLSKAHIRESLEMLGTLLSAVVAGALDKLEEEGEEGEEGEWRRGWGGRGRAQRMTNPREPWITRVLQMHG
eukprot:376522-Prymnesium_polylepis.1